MPTPGEILAAILACVVLAAMAYFMKNWLNGVKVSMENAVQSVIASLDEIKKQMTTLFQRSEQDRIERGKCQLEAAKTYATIHQFHELESRVRELERAE